MKISIITVCLNPGAYLEGCLDSVAHQRFDDYEHIVIDGGSSDGSVALLEGYSSPQLKWESGSDRGIAHAMNKGIAMAEGEWLVFLQADDRLIDEDALANAVKRMAVFEGVSLYGFRVKVMKGEGMSHIFEINPGKIWRKMPASHQGMFFRRTLFKEFGDYDESLRIGMDYDFVLRIFRAGVRLQKEDMFVAEVSGDGISSRKDWGSLRERFLEERRIHYRHAGTRIQRLGYGVYWVLYLPYRYLMNKWQGEG